MVDVGEAFTRKIGPLPAWGWGVAVGGGLLVMRMVRGGASSGSSREVIEVPTGAPMPADDFVSQLGDAVNDIRERLSDLENPDEEKEVSSPSTPTPETAGEPLAREFLKTYFGKKFTDKSAAQEAAIIADITNPKNLKQTGGFWWNAFGRYGLDWWKLPTWQRKSILSKFGELRKQLLNANAPATTETPAPTTQ